MNPIKLATKIFSEYRGDDQRNYLIGLQDERAQGVWEWQRTGEKTNKLLKVLFKKISINLSHSLTCCSSCPNLRPRALGPRPARRRRGRELRLLRRGRGLPQLRLLGGRGLQRRRVPRHLRAVRAGQRWGIGRHHGGAGRHGDHNDTGDWDHRNGKDHNGHHRTLTGGGIRPLIATFVFCTNEIKLYSRFFVRRLLIQFLFGKR